MSERRVQGDTSVEAALEQVRPGAWAAVPAQEGRGSSAYVARSATETVFFKWDVEAPVPHEDVTLNSGPAFNSQRHHSSHEGDEVSDLALAYQLPATGHVLCASQEEHGLVERARQGDLDAFDSIMACYETRLLRFLIGLVGDVDIAQELCQDTFLAAYQALPRLTGELKLSAWLHTIALNRARSHHRKKRFRTFLSLEDHILPSNEPDMQESVASHDAVQRTLERLPRNYAYPLLLQTAGGLSCREIAEILHCSESAVKVRLMRAREAFKRIYRTEVGDQCTS